MTPQQAIETIKQNAKAKFDESLEIHLRLGIDPSKSEQQVRGNLILPYGTGRKKKIAVFTEEKAEEAKKAGAEIAGGKELIEKIQKTKKCDFEIAVAEPGIMKDLSKIAKILGPKGLMPSPKDSTVTSDIIKAIKELNAGKINFKNDDTGNVHQILGKVSWPVEKLLKNFEAFIEAVKKAKPAKSKGIYFQNVVLCSTMGRGIKIELNR
jgi:large subunit ribosomal protein L1